MSRTTRSWWRVAAVFLAFSLVAGACGDDDEGKDAGGKGDSGGAKKTYALAFVGPKTGGDKNLGINILNGAKLAVDQFNESQDDIEIELKEFDTQGDKNFAPGQFELYNADASVLGLVGPAFSGETEAVLPQLQQAKLPMISASATRVSLADIVGSPLAAKTAEGYSVFHRALPNDASQAAGIAKFLKAKHANKSIFYAHDKQAYSAGLVDELKAAATPAGHKTAGTYEFADKDDVNMDSAVTAVGGAKPDIVFYGGYYPLAGRFKKALGDNDSTKDILFVSADGALDQGFLDGASPNADNAVIACPCNLATDSAPGDLGTFAKDYKKAFNQNAGTYSSEAYDAANMLMNGIKAGNTTREKLLAYVEGIKTYDGISKKIQFAENGNVTTDAVYFFKVKGGKFVPFGDTTKL
ncbi:MAG TPA: branched-chain amino acid ABC transporter substrate-binding protein [Acidimicrobiales bacterium]|nr:branched-chain amino acid ABC transporter substrate-binding protein [Acidimicrobiales bacterium]